MNLKTRNNIHHFFNNVENANQFIIFYMTKSGHLKKLFKPFINIVNQRINTGLDCNFTEKSAKASTVINLSQLISASVLLNHLRCTITEETSMFNSSNSRRFDRRRVDYVQKTLNQIIKSIHTKNPRLFAISIHWANHEKILLNFETLPSTILTDKAIKTTINNSVNVLGPLKNTQDYSQFCKTFVSEVNKNFNENAKNWSNDILEVQDEPDDRIFEGLFVNFLCNCLLSNYIPQLRRIRANTGRNFTIKKNAQLMRNEYFQ